MPSQISSAARSSASGTRQLRAGILSRRRQLADHVAGRAGKNVVAVRRRADLALDDHVHGGRGALGELAVLEQDGLECAGIDREPLEQNVREQRGRLDVAPRPARVRRGDRRDALLEQVSATAGSSVLV